MKKKPESADEQSRRDLKKSFRLIKNPRRLKTRLTKTKVRFKPLGDELPPAA